MRTSYKNIKQTEFYIWGSGKLLKRYSSQLPSDIVVKAIIDSDKQKWGKEVVDINGQKVSCIGIHESVQEIPVIIAIEDPASIATVGAVLDQENRAWCYIYDVVDSCFEKKNKGLYVEIEKKNNKIIRFIDTVVPISACNLSCKYCYLSQNKIKFDCTRFEYHSPNYIRNALSKVRLGGIAFINFCGIGETMLCNELLGIVKELIEEGHYIQIVTNATITKRIEEFLDAEMNLSQLLFKCSLHYRELKERNMLDIFAENVKKMKKAGASITVEITPEDSLVSQIEEIKQYCMDNFGALPHISVARNEAYSDYRVETDYTLEEYKQIWSQFESPMFDFKIANMNSQKNRDCKAGLWAIELNIATGEAQKCVNNPRLCNIYENLDEMISFEKIGKGCCMPYCFNNHAYLTWGLIPEVESPRYCDMRDRTTIDDEHWINEKMRNIMSQRLYENNGGR